KKAPKRGLTFLEAACVRHLGDYHPEKHKYHSNIAYALGKCGIVLKDMKKEEEEK
ncbi:hypothetical protein LCGC14_2877990, partial [marine sediment metagenome]